MKFAFYSDVHGDEVALERVFGQLEGVSRVICLGDLVGGAKDAECVERIRESGHIVVTGNHDLYPPEVEVLPAALQDFLGDLPSCHREADFLALHTYFVSLGSYRHFKYLYTAEEAAPLLAEFPDRLFFLGHTHVPSWMTVDARGVVVERPRASQVVKLDRCARYVVNPGMARDGMVFYDHEAQTLEFRLFEVPLDRFASARSAPLPWWRRILGR